MAEIEIEVAMPGITARNILWSLILVLDLNTMSLLVADRLGLLQGIATGAGMTITLALFMNMAVEPVLEVFRPERLDQAARIVGLRLVIAAPRIVRGVLIVVTVAELVSLLGQIRLFY